MRCAAVQAEEYVEKINVDHLKDDLEMRRRITHIESFLETDPNKKYELDDELEELDLLLFDLGEIKRIAGRGKA